MQTFLPFPSFAESAAVLDQARLGKQRVEVLQIQRALLVPTYGWQRHPAVGMWRGHLPALTAYGLAVVDAWTARGHADGTRPQMLEFAPEVDGLSDADLAERGLLPPWIGDEAVHASHRSRLVAKDPVFYGPLFPDAPRDLDYVWPDPPAPPTEPGPDRLWVLRAADPTIWRDSGLLPLPPLNPGGRTPPAWRAQVEAFERELEVGTEVALVDPVGALLHLARVTGGVAEVTVDDARYLVRSARFVGDLARRDLPVPAELQNPRALFQVALVRAGRAARVATPAAPAGATATGTLAG